jgi:hypothetical protein
MCNRRLTDEPSVGETGRKASLNHKKTIKYEKNYCNYPQHCDYVYRADCIQNYGIYYAGSRDFCTRSSLRIAVRIYFLQHTGTMLPCKIYNR